MALTTVWHDGNFDGDGYACGWSHVTWSKVDAWYHRGAFGSWMYYVPKLDMAITGTVNQMTREKEAREKVREIVEKLVDDGACRACGSK
jgi:CubicO group peptidase (beta-lactamase class C family)